MGRGLPALLMVLAAACFSPSFDDGAIPCGARGECPDGFACAEGSCWRKGHEPTPCQTGFRRQGGGCVDIDECAEGKDDCAEVATCANTAGSFTCACPATGYTGDGKSCTDIDECATGAAGCDADATCANMPGSFACACKAGFAGPGTSCWPDYVSFAESIDHGCAVRADGGLFCWGANGYGQLGLPADTVEVHRPTRVGNELWSSVAAGVRTSCAIRRDGTLWCWGENGCGVVGNGALPDLSCDGVRATFEMFPTGGTATKWKAVALGRSHACAVAMDGSLWCWGQNRAGELGTSDENNKLTPARVGADTAADKNWDLVVAGDDHSCGLRAGQLWCWGSNSRGQLGDDLAETKIAFPKRIGTAAGWQALAAGDDHTCGLLDGTLQCWGASDQGQLGVGKSGSGAQAAAPAAVSAPGGEGWGAVAAGGRVTCARTATTRRLLCWGENTYGELGDGGFANQDRPVRVGRDEDWERLAVGQRTACARKSDGRLLCFGRNLSGALGVGTGGGAIQPRDAGGPGFGQLSLGGNHACAIKSADKTLWCWGSNFNGQLGLGVAGGARDEPTQVRGGGAWSEVSAGETSSCAIKATGELYCWGSNAFGQLGDGSEGSDGQKLMPTRVADGGKTWTDVSMRSSHTCGIQTGGALFCWGASSLGRLGLGAVTGNVLTPRRVGEDTWTAVSAGGFHTCGLRGGALFCWGYDGNGQLGLNAQPPDNPSQLTPVRVGTFSDWSAVALGGSHTCGLRTAGGTLYCWGANFYGQVGNGSSGQNADQRQPVAIAFTQHWLVASPGDFTTCAVSSDGNPSCWGLNSGGLVGNGMVGQVVPTPVMIDTSRTYTATSLGNQTACGLRMDGSTACWGANTLGEFGDGTAFYEAPTLVAE